ncbi:MAG: branched-chain amino acid ABC transporter permease [Pontimonas sp.]
MDFVSILNNTAQALFSPVTIAFAMAALGLAIHFGFVGLLNFGIAGFMAVGAYGYAISTLTFGFPWWAAFLAAMAASAVFAVILGIPTLQLRGDYLAIVTIAAAEIVRLLLLSTTWIETTGSADGLVAYANDFRSINPFPDGVYGFGPWTYTANQFWVLIFALIILAVSAFLLWRLVKSPWGRVIKGIREDEDAVRALGKNVFAYKMQALIVGGIVAGLGGALYVMPSSANPMLFATSLTFFVWTALLLGGAATVFGPLLGAVIFWVLQAFLGSLLPAMAQAGLLGALSSAQAGALRFVLVGILLVVIVIVRPQGIVGDKRELTFVRK